MDTPSYIPAYEDEGRLTAQPWGEHPVVRQPEQEAAWITDVEARARDEFIAQARQAVADALENPAKEQSNGQ